MLSRAYVITVVGLSADNICRWAWPLYSNPTLLVFIPHTWSVPNAPPLGWSPGIESMGRRFECGCTVGVAGVCPALPKMSRDFVPSGTECVCCVYPALLPYFLCLRFLAGLSSVSLSSESIDVFESGSVIMDVGSLSPCLA